MKSAGHTFLLSTAMVIAFGHSAFGKASAEAVDPARSVVRINATLQSWNPWQPWEKDSPVKRRALGAIVAPHVVLTTAELAADAIFLEFESIDGARFVPARPLAIDYEANLALLTTAEPETAKTFFDNTRPFTLSKSPRIGDELSLVQVEANGSVLQTAGKLQSVDVTASLVPAGGFLTYLVKASMQNAASSYSLPVLRNGQLTGMLLTYSSKDQICDVASTEILSRFVTGALRQPWQGFPSLGISIVGTEDPSFRSWLKLSEDRGGIYIRHVRKGSAAEAAGMRKGDVLLAIDGIAIDRRGYCKHADYGNLFWGHWIRGVKSIGDRTVLSLWRDGAPLEVTANLTREDDASRVVPLHHYDHAPNYLVKGGLVFQELSLPLLESFGEDWQAQAPLALLSAYENPEALEGKVDRIVFLSGVIPTPATIGYEQLRSLVVDQVNGRAIRNLSELTQAFDGNTGRLHSIRFASENLTVHIDQTVSDAIDRELVQRGIRKLSRTDGKP